ncbi:HAD-IA family hydrolase [Patescibacteria group bacterium]|nr:HAD-IA family hydrolase [Patescibacteria group bacterium]
MIKTVIFDFDGVIADSLTYHFKKMSMIAKNDFGIKDNERVIIKEIRSKTYLELMRSFKISWTKLPLILKIINQAREEVFKNIDKIKIFPGIKKLLIDLKGKGYKLLILSSNLEKNITKFIEINGIAYFDKVYCEPRVFDKAKALKSIIRENKLKKEECIYIGDEIRDIKATKRVGLKIIVVGWGFHTKEILRKYYPDYIVNKPSGIMRVVERQ